MKWLYLLLILVLVPLVNAVPDYPHEFYGDVSDDNGLISSGTVTARLCNEEFSVQIVNGHYEPLLVWKEACSGVTIEFFVDGHKIRDYTYMSGAYTQINLNIPVVDNPPTNPPADNPPTDNNPQDTQTNNDNSNDGKERDTSHIKPPPEDLVFDSDKSEETGSNEVLHVSKYIGSTTGKAIYDTLTKTKAGIVTISITGSLSLLGLLYWLKTVL